MDRPTTENIRLRYAIAVRVVVSGENGETENNEPACLKCTCEGPSNMSVCGTMTSTITCVCVNIHNNAADAKPVYCYTRSVLDVVYCPSIDATKALTLKHCVLISTAGNMLGINIHMLPIILFLYMHTVK